MSKRLLVIESPGPLSLGVYKAVKERGWSLYVAREDLAYGDLDQAPVAAHYIDSMVPVTAFNDSDLVVKAQTIADFAERHAIDGVLTTYDVALPVTAAVADRLGLPHVSPEAVGYLRDKKAMREACARRGLPAPRWRVVCSSAAAVAAAEEFGSPVVLKPTLGTGSFGVTRADSPAEVEQAYGRAACAARERYAATEVLVEEYLEGPELSVESLVLNGEVLLQRITEKPLPMEGPAFAELMFCSPASFSEADAGRIREVNTATIQALGIRSGAMHIEMRLTPRGPYLLEANGRIGGQRVPRIVALSSGIDLVGGMVDVAVGRRPDLTPTVDRTAAFAPIYSPRPGTFCRLDGLDEARRVPGVESIEVIAQPGKRLRPVPEFIQENLGYVFSLTASPASAVGSLTTALQRIEVVLA